MLWGTALVQFFYQKHAYRYGFFPNANCPICPCTDSALHILSGCQHTKMRNVTIERHSNTASVPIVQAIQKGPCGANQIAYTDVGSADKLTEQGLKSEKHCQQNTALLVASKTKGKGGLHRYICLWWASERKLRKKPATKPKNASKIKGTACVYVCCGVCVWERRKSTANLLTNDDINRVQIVQIYGCELFVHPQW